jgi:predicted transcriptional regulator
MDTALEMLRSQNEWLLENRESIDAKIRQGLAELDRGEGISEDELDAYLD